MDPFLVLANRWNQTPQRPLPMLTGIVLTALLVAFGGAAMLLADRPPLPQSKPIAGPARHLLV